MRFVRFGLGERGKLSGADVAVRVIQILAILPALFTFIAPGYYSMMTRKGFFSTLFQLGMCSLPRWFTTALSFVYRLSASEVAMHFALLATALAFGLIMNGLLRGKPKKAFAVRVIFAVLIIADIIVRLLPLHINRVYSVPVTIFGFVMRLGCLALIILDLVAARRAEALKDEAPAD